MTLALPAACAALGWWAGAQLGARLLVARPHQAAGIQPGPDWGDGVLVVDRRTSASTWTRPAARAGTAIVCALFALRFGPTAQLPAFLYLGAIGVTLALTDATTLRLPSQVVIPSYAISGVLLTAAAVATGELSPLLHAGVGMVVLLINYLALALIHPAGMGAGDIKLAGVLGLYLGWLGWAQLIIGPFLGFLIAALVVLPLTLTRRVHRKTQIPFGPFLIAGAITAVLGGDLIATLLLTP